MHRTLDVVRSGVFVTSTNHYIPETMRLLDAMLDTEMQFSLYYGAKDATDGTGWTYNENGKIDTLNDGSAETDINLTLWEGVANFVANGVMDDDWNKFVSKFETMGVTDYIKRYQAAISTMDIK